ncbi:MAG: hypothetical protein ACP5GU_05680 [Thermoprotei archaeon]
MRRVIKKIPKIFICPRCGRQAVSVEFNNDHTEAYVKCAYCNLSGHVQVKKIHEAVDAYNIFVDEYYGGKISEVRASGT